MIRAATGALVVLSFLMIFISAITLPALGDRPAITLPLVKDSEKLIAIDGVWTSLNEWSRASLMIVNYTDGTQLVIRGQHDSSSLFMLLEMPEDHVLDGRGAVCFDTNNDAGPYMNPDDYCFLVGSNDRLIEYNGDGRTTLMQQAALNPSVAGARGLSNESSSNKSAESHVTYEFKIPLKELGDHNSYGFFVTYETRGQDSSYTYNYSWPDYNSAASLRVASPRDWGHVEISSQSVVPEFPLQTVGIIAATTLGIFALTTRTKIFKLYKT
jgi:hypothetical protein